MQCVCGRRINFDGVYSEFIENQRFEERWCVAPLLHHLEEEQVGQLSDVLVVGDPVVPQDVTEIPKAPDDCLVGRGREDKLKGPRFQGEL